MILIFFKIYFEWHDTENQQYSHWREWLELPVGVRDLKNVCCLSSLFTMGKMLQLSVDHHAGRLLCKLWEHRLSPTSSLPHPLLLAKSFSPLTAEKNRARNKRFQLPWFCWFQQPIRSCRIVLTIRVAAKIWPQWAQAYETLDQAQF